jgi:lysyl-tRNA synthetase class 2
MKKIISEHRVNVYQICRCFRNGESTGHLHNHEFAMLEYYTMDADYKDSLLLTEELFAYLAGDGLLPPFERVIVAEAFSRWAGVDLYDAAGKEGALEETARSLGLDPPPGMTVGGLYDLIFIHTVEPRLKTEKPVALLDYPAFVPCLAKKSSDGKTVERWELYYNGIELANCFSEETDPENVKRFFIQEAAAKEKSSLVRHGVDDGYYKLFNRKSDGKGFPRCSGVALGLDRLIMALTKRASIDEVIPFLTRPS